MVIGCTVSTLDTLHKYMVSPSDDWETSKRNSKEHHSHLKRNHIGPSQTHRVLETAVVRKGE